jgi:two-component system chemotaxis sensor kinase CheA
VTTFGDGFLADYFAECDEHLSTIRHALLALEESVGQPRPDPRVSEELFRAYHSLKGLAGMVEDRHTESLAHEMESYLRALRSGDVVLASFGVDALIDGTGALEHAIAAHQRRSAPPDNTATLTRLRDLLGTAAAASPAPSASHDLAGVLLPDPWECVFRPSAALSARGMNVNTVRARLREVGEIAGAAPVISGDGGVAFRFVFGGPVDEARVRAWREDGMTCGPLAAAIAVGAEPAAPAPAGARPSAHFVRVDLARLDELMRMIGDMVILRARLSDALSRVEAHVPAQEWRPVQENAAGLERQLRDLREGVMRVRLVPVGEIFRRMPFVVRDLARETDRRARVVLAGQETQIDKYLVERMMDPLLHLVRNAVSHGLEPASERIAAGKSPEGTVSLSARAAGEMVTLEIADDGRGVVADRVLARARHAGLPVPRTADADDAALLELLCSPGFSTRDEADRVSGRGFGMAVVHTTVQELGGTMRMESSPGVGTRFIIELPLTLAVTDALIAAVGSQTFAVPQSAVREVIEVEAAAIRQLADGEVVPFRAQALPIIRLSSALGIPSSSRLRHHAFVVGTGPATVGLLVDRVLSQREIVVRTTVDPLIRVDGIAGATDLGDGRAVLILDVASVARAARARQHDRHATGTREIA